VVLAPCRAASACARHNVIALDLPAADESAGLDVYADVIVKTIGDRPDVVLVAHSMGAFPATMVCERASVASLVRVVPMIPPPGETPGQRWTGSVQLDAMCEGDLRDGAIPGRST
jgi:hypothetical protein